MTSEQVPQFRRRPSDEVIVEPEFTWAVAPDTSGESRLVVFKLMSRDDPKGDYVRIGFDAVRARELAMAVNEAADALA